RTVSAVAEVHVLDRFSFDPAPGHRVLDGMSGQAHRGGDVEAATGGLRQPSPRIGDEHCFTGHGDLQVPSRLTRTLSLREVRPSERMPSAAPGREPGDGGLTCNVVLLPFRPPRELHAPDRARGVGNRRYRSAINSRSRGAGGTISDGLYASDSHSAVPTRR